MKFDLVHQIVSRREARVGAGHDTNVMIGDFKVSQASWCGN